MAVDPAAPLHHLPDHWRARPLDLHRIVAATGGGKLLQDAGNFQDLLTQIWVRLDTKNLALKASATHEKVAQSCP